jgi:hypothetical protein
MISRRTVLLLPLFAAACASDDGPQNYPMPSYSYLTPLRLNVASIQIDDRTPPVPSGDRVMTTAPLRPADALKQMANDRLFPGGTVGRAVFVIDQAYIRRVGDGVDGRMAVHLDIYAGGDSRVGFAEAQVARRRVSTDTSENPRTVLYNFVTQMMSDMNVEFEFQVRRSLKEYLQDTATAVPTPAPVQSQDLAPPTPLAAPQRQAPAPAAPMTGILRRPSGY